MVEFNIESAKEGAKLQTRSGHPARIICYDRQSERDEFPIVALVEITEGYEETYYYTSDGKYYANTDIEDGFDLVIVPRQNKGYVNLYRTASGCICVSPFFHTMEDAMKEKEKMFDVTYLNTNEVNWEE